MFVSDTHLTVLKVCMLPPRSYCGGIMQRWPLSVCPSILYLIICREQKGVGSWKFGMRKVHDTGDPWPHLEIKRSRSPDRLTPWHKIRHIFKTRRPAILKLGTRMDVRWPVPPTCAVTSKVKDRGYTVTSSFWRVFALDREKSQKHQTRLEVCPCHNLHCTPVPRSPDR